MATSERQSSDVSSTKQSSKHSKKSNLESFACLWLDQNVNSTEDNRGTQQELRQVINHLRIYDNSDDCEQCIKQITQEKVILIVSGSLGRQIVPRLHDLPQFSACYVFCQDKKANEQWANEYHKINGVFVKRTELIAQISKDQVARTKIEDGASISVLNSGSQSLQARNAIFMWFQLFIEVLIRMHHKSTDRKELIDICKNNYKGNHQEIMIIDEFDKNYKADDAIRWYTRESCFYRMMNKALRVQDFDMLFAFRFFIADIAKQVKSEYEKFIRTSDTRNIIQVYRGQVIGNDELDLMKNSVGEFLSMNSFLSTSRNRLTALRFAQSAPITHGIQRILFEIKIDPRLQTKAFASIVEMSYYGEEDEVLIILGALFRIDKVIENEEERIWIAYVSLASEDDYHLKETFSYMKKTIGDETDLDSLGKILLEMGEYEQARKCYKRMVDETKLVLGNAEAGLGLACLDCKMEDETFEHLEEALNIRKSLLGQDHADVGECYNYIGMAQWWSSHNYSESLVNLQKAMKIQEKTLPIDSLALARTYGNIACVYYFTKEYDLALQYYNETLNIRQKVLPSNHPRIATTYNNLGGVYEDKKDYSKALEYYRKSLEMYQKALPPAHPDIVMAETNVRRLKEKMKQ